MKKTYQIPTINVVKIETAKMIATSETLGFGDGVNTASGAESRGGSAWDDDEY